MDIFMCVLLGVVFVTIFVVLKVLKTDLDAIDKMSKGE